MERWDNNPNKNTFLVDKGTCFTKNKYLPTNPDMYENTMINSPKYNPVPPILNRKTNAITVTGNDMKGTKNRLIIDIKIDLVS